MDLESLSYMVSFYGNCDKIKAMLGKKEFPESCNIKSKIQTFSPSTRRKPCYD